MIYIQRHEKYNDKQQIKNSYNSRFVGNVDLGKLIEMLAVLTKFYFLSGCWVFKRLSHYVQYLFYK